MKIAKTLQDVVNLPEMLPVDSMPATVRSFYFHELENQKKILARLIADHENGVENGIVTYDVSVEGWGEDTAALLGRALAHVALNRELARSESYLDYAKRMTRDNA